MHRLRTKVGIAATLTLALALLAASCGGDGSEETSTLSPGATAPATTGGTIPTVGSGQVKGQIAFETNRDGDYEIYVMDADGSDQRNVTNSPSSSDFDPDWSPDGKYLAFDSDRNGARQVYVMDADGGNVRQLTTDSSGGLGPRWSRDGSKIAFSRAGSIAVVDADGGNLKVIMAAEPENTAAPCRAGSFPGSWSPDSRRVSYYAASSSRQEAQVCSIGVDGSDIEVVVAEAKVLDVEPQWSPDGRYILYRRVADGQHDIWVIDLETGKKTGLTDDSFTDIEPSWSPDGQWIVFGSSRENEFFDLFIMRPDGSDIRRLTATAPKEANPVWAP